MLIQRPLIGVVARGQNCCHFDHLLAWADDLYRIDTRESINEALQLYVLASQILGRRPTLVKGRQAQYAVFPMVGALYFCIPANPKVLQYWNLVEARLFNIRHCRNIEGVARTLPLLDAAIDPELLVRAVAAGLDIGEVVRGLYSPPHPYRAQVLAAGVTKGVGGSSIWAKRRPKRS